MSAFISYLSHALSVLYLIPFLGVMSIEEFNANKYQSIIERARSWPAKFNLIITLASSYNHKNIFYATIQPQGNFPHFNELRHQWEEKTLNLVNWYLGGAFVFGNFKSRSYCSVKEEQMVWFKECICTLPPNIFTVKWTCHFKKKGSFELSFVAWGLKSRALIFSSAFTVGQCCAMNALQISQAWNNSDAVTQGIANDMRAVISIVRCNDNKITLYWNRIIADNGQVVYVLNNG